MCSIRIRNLRCALILNERRKSEKKKFGREKPGKRVKYLPKGQTWQLCGKVFRKKKTRLGKEAKKVSRTHSLFRIYLKTTLERNEKNVSRDARLRPQNTQTGSCSVVSPTVLNHHHHHHHHLTRRGGREREEAIRWRDKKRERSSCVFVLRVCARSLLSRLSLIISRCCNSAEEAQHRGNEDTESFGNS